MIRATPRTISILRMSILRRSPHVKIRIIVPKFVFAITMALVLAGTALAAAGGITIKEGQFNPDNVNATIAAARVAGAGNPDLTDPQDKQHYGWLLARNNTLSPPGPEASADLTVMFAGPTIMVSQAGFDRLTGATQCGGGSPRYNVETAAGVLFLECDQPAGPVVEAPGFTVTTTRTDLGNGWERIVFNISPAAEATFLQVLSDSGPGAALVDNINVNGTLIGR